MNRDAAKTVAAAVEGVFGDPALETLLAEAGALFHRLRHDSELLHERGEFSSGMRAILRSLERIGPQTVPQMARARPVSRQYVQRLVNDLAAEGSVEPIENPAHKRSRLIRITENGRRALVRMERREKSALDGLVFGVDRTEMARAAETLRKVRQVFEGDAWRRRIESGHGDQPAEN